MAVVKLAILFSGRRLDCRYGHDGMKIGKSLSLREIADSTKRESAPPAYDTLHHYTWDADGNLVTVDSSMTVTYDAFDRVAEIAGNSSTQQVVYGPGGGKLALMSGQTLDKAFVPLAGGAQAVYTSSGLAYYRHTDWLGSSRLASTPSRTVHSEEAYGPYGESYAETGTTDLEFAGMEQDIVSSGAYPLYDALMREYHPTWGRWLSPDPAGVAAANPANPQTWNRYAYVSNNPLSFVDPQGLGRCVPGAPNYENDCQPPSGEGYTGDSYSEWPVNNMDPACGANVPWSYERYHMCGSELATLPLRPIGPKMMKSLLPQVKCDATPKQEQQILQASKQFNNIPYAHQECNDFICNSINASGVLVGKMWVNTKTIFGSSLFRRVDSSGIQSGDVDVFSNPSPYHMGFVVSGQYPNESILSATVDPAPGGPRTVPEVWPTGSVSFPGTQTFFRLQVPCP